MHIAMRDFVCFHSNFLGWLTLDKGPSPKRRVFIFLIKPYHALLSTVLYDSYDSTNSTVPRSTTTFILPAYSYFNHCDLTIQYASLEMLCIILGTQTTRWNTTIFAIASVYHFASRYDDIWKDQIRQPRQVHQYMPQTEHYS
jgi:hypothetical protein